jgi:hypothetical protein
MDIEIPTLEQVLAKVDDFLTRHEMAETRLGRDATGESSLISGMRAGRHPSLKTLLRLQAHMAEQDERVSAASGDMSPGKCDGITGAPSGTAVCSFCERPAADPAVAACVEPDCALRPREVA